MTSNKRDRRSMDKTAKEAISIASDQRILLGFQAYPAAATFGSET